MELWLAALLFIVCVCGLAVFLLFCSRKKKKALLIIGLCVLGVLLLVLAAYIVLTIIFVDSASSKLPPSSVSAQSTAPFAPEPMPEDYDLPVSEVPEIYPDILNVRNRKYEPTPTFDTLNDISIYVLHSILNNRFEMDFNISKKLAPDENSAPILFRAYENAGAYFPFDTFNIWDAYLKDNGNSENISARLALKYSGNKDFDLEACAEAMEFVKKNPVPYDGFADAQSEKAYVRKIHDFIARKITYSPIGYNIKEALSQDSYKMKQEAYNALAEEQSDAVCAGYARSFAMVCHYAGINAAYMRGNEDEEESHAWNVIFPLDGSAPVLVDVTWDDTESDDLVGQKTVSDRYFYLPLDEDSLHTPLDYIDAFLRFANKR